MALRFQGRLDDFNFQGRIISSSRRKTRIHILCHNCASSNMGFDSSIFLFFKLLRVTAICLRFLAILNRITNSSLLRPIGPKDLDLVKTTWIKITQGTYFLSDIKNLKQGINFPKSHPFSRLNPFIDHEGVVRVGGRLNHSTSDNESKHPAILPKNSPYTRFIIEEAHSRTFHGGTQLTLACISYSYWIIGGRQPVRSFILKCIQSITNHPQILKGSWSKNKKGWICLFVCLTISALHLEVVTDYTTEGFLSAYRRFTSRRSICRTLYSDCTVTVTLQ
ncbi:uncharacterized protein LOC122504131 [Leptopilina heterotoma]|uniref:uncharacterized protein LOC122504131 n=1 Tax=Leptopilina heterotoma TaxID=63436 RepID=UPI001CA8D659|nr:uncharacterized protein LOC122504131 [Leptopilina heterotoma]